MKSKTLIIIGVVVMKCCLCLQVVSQNLPAKWEKIDLAGLGSIEISPKLEVRNNNSHSAQVIRSVKNQSGISTSQFIAQQKGLNQPTPQSQDYYARLMIKTTLGIPGEYKKLDQDLNLSATQLNQINNETREATENQAKMMNMAIVKWYPVEVIQFNNMICVKTQFIREQSGKPNTIVSQYRFQNFDRVHDITISYYVTKSEYYEKDFERMLNSFIITYRK
jgi:hypothetical protein